MRVEDLKKPCPECGAVDKDVSTVKHPQKKEKLKEAGIPEDQEIVGAIKCSNCGYVFEYCAGGTCKIEVRKVSLD